MAHARIARQAIFNINGKIHAYELIFHHEDKRISEVTTELLSTSKVLLNLLTHLDFEEIVSTRRRAFVRFDHEVFFSGIIGLLNPKLFVIELICDTKIDIKLISRLDKLKKKGFVFALGDYDGSKEMFEKFKPLMQYMDYVKFEASHIGTAQARKHIVYLQEHRIQVIAEGIKNQEVYKDCVGLKYNFYQGMHIRGIESFDVEIPTHTSRSGILQLVAMIRGDKETDDIVEYAKTQPDLVHNLLKYLNSPAVGLKYEIHSVEHAIATLGRDKLVRWLLLCVYSQSAGDEISANLLDIVLRRAERMEEMGRSRVEKDKAYLVGLLSLLDVLFDTSISVILRGLPVDYEIREALISHKGVLGRALEKVEMKEKEALRIVVNDQFDHLRAGDLMKMLKKNDIDIDVKNILKKEEDNPTKN